MASQLTITGKTGPAVTVTAQVLTNVTQFNMALGGKSFLEVFCDQGRKEYDLNATTTLTCTISAGNATLVVSQ
jgi:hypothetical protein